MLGTGNLRKLSTSEVMDIGREPTTTTLLNLYHPKLQPKHLSLYPQIIVFLISHQGNFFVQQVEAITENHNNSNCMAVQPSLSE